MNLDAPQWGGTAPGHGPARVGRSNDAKTSNTAHRSMDAVGDAKTAATSKYIFKPTTVSRAAVGSPGQKTLVMALHCPAGTGATVYNGWVEAFKAAFSEGSSLSEHVDVVHLLPIELPGRGLRMKEPLRTRMDEIATEISLALQGYMASAGLDGPGTSETYVCVFGHSLGGWIGFEVMRRLVASGRQARDGDVENTPGGGSVTPLCLIASGIRSPTLCGVENDIDSTAMHALGEEDIWKVMERRYGVNKELEHPSVRRMMWPILKADFTVSETYQYDGCQVDLPIFVSGGAEDVRYDRGMLEAWSGCRSGCRSGNGSGNNNGSAGFDVEMFGGGHHYLFSKAESMEGHVSWVMDRLKASFALIGDQVSVSTSDKNEMNQEMNAHDEDDGAESDHEGADGQLEGLRTNRSDLASLMSEVESSIFANPGTTQAISDVLEMDRESTGTTEEGASDGSHGGAQLGNSQGEGDGAKAPRTESNEPRCRICSVM